MRLKHISNKRNISFSSSADASHVQRNLSLFVLKINSQNHGQYPLQINQTQTSNNQYKFPFGIQ